MRFNFPCRVASLLAGLVLTFNAADGADWPQWRGPAVDGISSESLTTPQDEIPRLSVLWRQNIGVGFGTVSVHGDRLFALGWKQGSDHVYCLNVADGSEHWTYRYREDAHDNMHHGGPSATPAVDATGVFTISKSGIVHCLSPEDGSLRWRIDAPQQFGVTVPTWGFSGSPILLGKAVIADLGRVVALDRLTGRLQWKSSNFGSAYSTPVPFQRDRHRLLATFPVQGLVILDAAKGNSLATYPWKTSYNVHAATPVVQGEQILITSGYGSGAALLRLGHDGLTAVWESKDLASRMSSPVLVEDHIYGFDGSRLVCIELATGERRWATKGLGQGSLLVAGQHLVVLSEDGKLVIAPLSPDSFSETASLKLFDADQGWIMPVVAEGRIFCRSGKGDLAAVTLTH